MGDVAAKFTNADAYAKPTKRPPKSKRARRKRAGSFRNQISDSTNQQELLPSFPPEML